MGIPGGPFFYILAKFSFIIRNNSSFYAGKKNIRIFAVIILLVLCPKGQKSSKM